MSTKTIREKVPIANFMEWGLKLIYICRQVKVKSETSNTNAKIKVDTDLKLMEPMAAMATPIPGITGQHLDLLEFSF
jgi:hypothetical protein